MTSKSRPRTISVYLYIPNIIGYIRVLLNCYAFAICFTNKELFSILYFISFVCDALDGWFANLVKFQPSGLFWTWISTACLLVILSQVYRPIFVFLSLLALDIASHWLQMYSTFLVGKSNHKDVKDSTSWLFKLYYGNRMFMGYCCVACEVLYITLFLLAKESEKMTDVLLCAAKQSIIYSALLALLLFGWATKQLVNIIQMKTAADLCVLYDLNKKRNA
ncbi:hypothetical protein L1987_15029 [Smallanthus sonchifolius]|uniref:Uncharacterized protein n=1 Tax=Smallanthus sonchifolius TaxID=185202 RepID=A0ACB9J4H6_9ASTR|nr:hypothetical protein L1987_15029 [Smallanthus sonchifolius]